MRRAVLVVNPFATRVTEERVEAVRAALERGASVETLFNLNKETKALNVDPPHDPGVDPFHDTRMIAKLGVGTTLFKSLSAALGFRLRSFCSCRLITVCRC